MRAGEGTAVAQTFPNGPQLSRSRRVALRLFWVIFLTIREFLLTQSLKSRDRIISPGCCDL
jgi:hypothetical protein